MQNVVPAKTLRGYATYQSPTGLYTNYAPKFDCTASRVYHLTESAQIVTVEFRDDVPIKTYPIGELNKVLTDLYENKIR